MKYILKLGLILLIFCAVASGILAFVNSKTQPVITARKLLEEEQTRKDLLPLAKTFELKKAEADSNFVYYIAKDDAENTIGYSFIAAKSGYSSVVKSMVALDKDYKVINMKVIDQNETPGLGTNCATKDFPNRFKGLGLDEIKVDKDGGKVASLTGATITTRAVTNSIRDAITTLKTDIEAHATVGGV
jgi:electron transport complex protein RnfG